MAAAEPGERDRLSDEALVAGLAAGEADSARLLIRRYQARVHGLALTLVRDRAAAEDVAQEAFLRAWRHAGSYDARRGTVAAWLLRITRNLAIDTLRLRRADPMDPSLLAAVGPASNATSVHDAVETSDTTAQVRAALRHLPAEQSRALLLAAWHGHTAEEISRLEDIPLGTAKTRMRLGLRKLRARLVEPIDASRTEA